MSAPEATARYLESVRKLVSGEVTSYEDYMHHFHVQNSGVRSGPEIGEGFPDFALADPSGRTRRFGDLAGPNGLLLVVVRSANWCSYCRNQLAELNRCVDDLRARGVGLAAVATDEREIVVRVAEHAALRYPLLFDAGARFIEALGILNPNIPPESIAQNNGRVPFPGHYLIDAKQRVRDKEFTDDLRHRMSGTALAFRHFGSGPAAVEARLASPQMKATIALSSKRLNMGQDVALKATFELSPGWHAYGSPLPAGYTGLRIAFEEGLVQAQRYAYPVAEHLHLPALRETLPVYSRRFEVNGTLRLRWSAPLFRPPFLNGLRERLEVERTKPGAHVLTGALEYQLCDERECLMPARVPFELLIELEEDVTRLIAPPVPKLQVQSNR